MPSNDSSSNASDIVFAILNGTPFKLRPDDEKLKILKAGRPEPNFTITLKDSTTNTLRSFQSWYSIHRWLCGSRTYNKVFCWPCLLMRPETSSWCSVGTDDLKKFPFLANKHSLSKSHQKAISEYNETLTSFGLPVEFFNKGSLDCKEEDLIAQTDDDNDLAMESHESNKQKSADVSPEDSNQRSLNSGSKGRISFKMWQEIQKSNFPVSREKFLEDANLYKYRRKTAKQEYKNSKLAGEKLKLEIEVLKAKAEFYKNLKENDVPFMPSAVTPQEHE